MLGEADFIRDSKKAVFAVGSTHKEIDFTKLSRELPIEVLYAKTMRHGAWWWWFIPLPMPIRFIMKVNDPSCIVDLVNKLNWFLLMGIYVVDTKLVSEFVAAAYSHVPLKMLRVLESDDSSLVYVVNFDNQECETGIMEYWTFDASLSKELALYV